MKKKRGCKKGSGVLSGIKPERETWDDIRRRIIYDSAEWPLVGLRMSIGDGSKLADNYLSARAAANAETARQERYVLLDTIDVLWKEFCARFERAALDGDADWFELQAKALRSVSVERQWRIIFNAKVVYLLEQAMWGTHVRQGMKRKLPRGDSMMEGVEDLTLTPAGKFTDAMARHIYKALDVRYPRSGGLLVEGCRLFKSEKAVMDAIRDLAEQIDFELKKQPRPKRWKR